MTHVYADMLDESDNFTKHMFHYVPDMPFEVQDGMGLVINGATVQTRLTSLFSRLTLTASSANFLLHSCTKNWLLPPGFYLGKILLPLLKPLASLLMDLDFHWEVGVAGAAVVD